MPLLLMSVAAIAGVLLLGHMNKPGAIVPKDGGKPQDKSTPSKSSGGFSWSDLDPTTSKAQRHEGAGGAVRSVIGKAFSALFG